MEESVRKEDLTTKEIASDWRYEEISSAWAQRSNESHMKGRWKDGRRTREIMRTSGREVFKLCAPTKIVMLDG